MNKQHPRFGEDEARLLWRRAAELQAAAERAQSLALARPGSGLTLHEITAAAESAGIDPDFVRIAHAERQLPDAAEIDPHARSTRLLGLVTGAAADAFELTRFMQAQAPRVLEAVRVVFAEPQYGLVPELLLGERATEDGVLVYRANKTKDSQSFHDNLSWADVRVLIVVVRPEAGGTRIRVRVPMFRRKLNVGILGVFAGMGGYAGGAAGAALGGSLVVLGAPAVAAAAAAAALAAGGAFLGGVGFRSIYWWSTNGARSSLVSLLNAVALRAESTALELPRSTTTTEIG